MYPIHGTVAIKKSGANSCGFFHHTFCNDGLSPRCDFLLFMMDMSHVCSTVDFPVTSGQRYAHSIYRYESLIHGDLVNQQGRKNRIEN